MRLNQRGQMTMEMMLMLAIIVGSMIAVSNAAKEGKWMENLVSGPWKPLQGMIEDGVWQNTKESKASNPSIRRRHGSFDPQDQI